MRRLAFYLFTAAMTVGVLTITASPAHANIPVTCGSAPDAGWYVNDDEGSLAPTWTPDGLVFDGPGLVHHAVASSLALADLTPGTFTQTGLSGALPLLKFETSSPYSTVNQAESGVDSFWSSKIPASDTGGQDHPVAAADLAALAPYTADTTVTTFGIGYAKDTGNADTITSLTFGGDTYRFSPCPTPPAPPAAGGGSTPTHRPTPTPTHRATTPAGHPAQAGGAPVGNGRVTPAVAPSSVSPAPSDSYDPLAAVPATTDPGFSVAPVVPEQVTPMVKASGSSNAGYFIGSGLALVAVVIGGVLLLRRRRNAPRDADDTAIFPRHGAGEQP